MLKPSLLLFSWNFQHWNLQIVHWLAQTVVPLLAESGWPSKTSTVTRKGPSQFVRCLIQVRLVLGVIHKNRFSSSTSKNVVSWLTTLLHLKSTRNNNVNRLITLCPSMSHVVSRLTLFFPAEYKDAFILNTIL